MGGGFGGCWVGWGGGLDGTEGVLGLIREG